MRSSYFSILFFIFPYFQANINEDDVYKIYNDAEVIFISSLTDYMDNETNSWFWKYSGPEGYGFKVVIEIFDSSLMNEFFIKNSTDMLVNKRSAKEYHPYYNSDNYIEIYLSLIENRDVLLVAYLTIINNHPNETIIHGLNGDHSFCPIIPVKKKKIIWFIGITFFSVPPFFDAKNVQCSYDLIIPYKEEVDVSVLMIYMEKGVDILKYSFTTIENINTTVILHPTSVDPGLFSGVTFVPDNTFTLESYLNGSEKHYWWEWTTDGSIVSTGFYVEFKKISCECNAKDILCETVAQGIMNKKSGRYCGNMRCNFTVVPCRSNITVLTIQLSDCHFDEMTPQPYNLDIFKVYSNDDVVMEINNYNRMEQHFEIYLNSSKYHIFEAITFSSGIARCLLLQTQKLREIPIPYEITLTPSVPYIVIDTGIYQSVAIVSEFENSTIVLISSKARGVPLYDNINFFKRHVSGQCFSDYNLYQCEITSNKIGLHQPALFDIEYFPILSIYSVNSHQKGCVFKNYIFISNADSPNTPITIISTAEDECVGTLLLEVQEYVYYTITYFWTNSQKDNVKINAGLDHLIFEFNSRSTKKWTEIELFSHLYTIKVPKNATLYMRIERQIGGFKPFKYFLNFLNVDTIVIYVLKPNFFALLSTPEYGTSKTSHHVNLITYFFGNFTLRFTTLYYNSLYNEIYFSFYYKMDKDPHITKNQIFRINQTGDTFFFNKGMISITFNPNYNIDLRNGALFLIEVVN